MTALPLGRVEEMGLRLQLDGLMDAGAGGSEIRPYAHPRRPPAYRAAIWVHFGLDYRRLTVL
jgi:hypothetical protein